MHWNSFTRRIRYIVRKCMCYDLAIQEGLNPLDRKIRRQMNAKINEALKIDQHYWEKRCIDFCKE